jgi:hypothetical protein
MAEGTGFVAIYRELLIVKQGLPKQLYLLNLTVGYYSYTREGLRFDSIDLCPHTFDRLQDIWRETRQVVSAVRSPDSRRRDCERSCHDGHVDVGFHLSR